MHRISSWALNVLNPTESSQERPTNERSNVLHFDVWGWNKKTRARKSKGPSPLLSIPCLLLSALKKKKKNPPLDWLMTKSHSPRAHLLLERHLMMNGKLLPSPHPTHSVLPSNEKKKSFQLEELNENSRSQLWVRSQVLGFFSSPEHHSHLGCSSRRMAQSPE